MEGNSVEFEKLQQIIADVLSVDVDEIKPETTFRDDLGRTAWMSSRSSWGWRKSSISRYQQRKQRRL